MHYFKRSIPKLFALALMVGLFGMVPHAAHAAFDPNNIIDDSVFTNKSSMSANDIQAFLNGKVSTCDTNHPKDSSNASYDNPPWVCLKSFSEGGRSAAQIIYDAAQTYSVNPQVILVTLQKEQALVTDTWPGQSKYRAAMGMGCPDTAACDSQYYGFTNQVNQGTRLLRGVYDQRSDWTILYRPGSNYVRYNPNSGCGGSTLSINRATAALYQYTPYQPNAAALNNLYGYGDGCSAYGNRNFYRDFTAWFGSTHGSPYAADFAGQSAYPTIGPGGSVTGYLKYQNSGNSTWYDDISISGAGAGNYAVHLATSGPVNRASQFGSTWGANANRPALTFAAVYESNGTTLATNQHVAAPGQIVKFNIPFTAASSASTGVYRESFRLVAEGTGDGGFGGNDAWLDVTVSAVYSDSLSSQGPAPTVRPGAPADTYLSYANTGNAPWYDDLSVYAVSGGNPTHLATSHAINRTSIFGADWGTGGNRPASTFAAVYEANGTTPAANQHVVQPGQIGRFNLTFKAPSQQAANTYTEYFQPIQEGTSDGAMNDPNTSIVATVPSASVGSSTTSSTTSGAMTPGATRSYTASFTNVGNTTWASSTTNLIGNPSTSYQSFKDASWPSATVLAHLNEASVAPGAIGTFTFTLSAPYASGNYALELAPSNDANYATPVPAKYQISVAPPVYRAGYAGQSAYPSGLAGSSQAGFIKYKNNGNINWYDDSSISGAPAGSYSTHLATANPVNHRSPFGSGWGANGNRPNLTFSAVYESDGTTLASNQHIVQPGQIAKYSFTFTIPASQGRGTYTEYFQPVAEGSADGAFNDPGTYLEISVSPVTYSAQFVGQSTYPTVARGATSAGYFSYKNVGNVSWYDDSSIGGAPTGSYPTHLATSSPTNRSSVFGSTWGANHNRPALAFAAVYEADGTTLAANQHVVAPGQIGKLAFTFSVSGSQATGAYREYFQPVAEGTADGAFNVIGTYLDVTVTP